MNKFEFGKAHKSFPMAQYTQVNGLVRREKVEVSMYGLMGAAMKGSGKTMSSMVLAKLPIQVGRPMKVDG